MATYKLGKLKFNLSKAGLAFRWGDGEIRRFPFGLKSTQGEDVAEGLDQFGDAYEDGAQGQEYDDYAAGDAGDYGYDDGDYAGGDSSYTYEDGDYADEGGYDDGGYADDGSYDDGGYADNGGNYADGGEYTDDGYADDGYADDGYDDGGYTDNGYDDGAYTDDGYADGDYAEGDDGYYDEDGNYIEGGSGEPQSFMQYIDENDWVTYVLLVLFPPLGIYLLWRRGRFDKLLRIGISIASALWFAVLIYLIVSLASPQAENTITPGGPTISPITPTPTVSVMPSSSIAPTGSALPGASPTAGIDGIVDEPTATPIAGGSSGDATGEFVWAGNTGLYYHSNRNCPQLGSDTPQYVSLEIAERRGLEPCPTCYNQQTYYMTDGGTYYHTNPTCDGGTGVAMRNAYQTTKERAEAAGKRACPVCAGGTQVTPTPNVASMLNATAVQNYARTLTTDRSGVMVYATRDGTYFHTDPTCRGMENASRISLLAALQNGKRACPDCCAVAGNVVYCTENGEWFHVDSDCQGMRNARQTYVALALVMGKTPCPECLSGVTINLDSPSSSGGSSSGGSSSSSGGVYVYATEGGQYYHSDSTCGGMRNAERVPLSAMLAIGRPACPDCCPTANNTVYATRGGTYYHSYATCSGMTGATPGTVAQALAAGFQKCPYCWSSGGSGSGSGQSTGGNSTESISGVTVYCTDNGTWYHNDQYCQGMRSAYAVSLEEAVARGKTACPVCCSIADRVVYAVNGGQYYHYNSSCRVEDLSRATSGTLARALMAGFGACPSCVRGDSSSGGGAESDSVTDTYEPGTSGIRVYATQSGEYYHLTRECAGSEASYITLETALNYGKTSCPVCARVDDGPHRLVHARRPLLPHLPRARRRERHARHAGRGLRRGQGILPGLQGPL